MLSLLCRQQIFTRSLAVQVKLITNQINVATTGLTSSIFTMPFGCSRGFDYFASQGENLLLDCIDLSLASFGGRGGRLHDG
jgi:hypothetical protein